MGVVVAGSQGGHDSLPLIAHGHDLCQHRLILRASHCGRSSKAWVNQESKGQLPGPPTPAQGPAAGWGGRLLLLRGPATHLAWMPRLPLARCYLKREQSCKFKREKSDPDFWWLPSPKDVGTHMRVLEGARRTGPRSGPLPPHLTLTWTPGMPWGRTPLTGSYPLRQQAGAGTCLRQGPEGRMWRTPGQQWVRPLGVLRCLG